MAVKITAKVEPVIGYTFGGSQTQGNASMKDVLGGKGANLAGDGFHCIPVPAGFTIPCSASVRFKAYKGNGSAMCSFLSSLWDSVFKGLNFIKQVQGDLTLVSVRSGSRVSMPGMMDTILNFSRELRLPTLLLRSWVLALPHDSYRRLDPDVFLGLPRSSHGEV